MKRFGFQETPERVKQNKLTEHWIPSNGIICSTEVEMRNRMMFGCDLGGQSLIKEPVSQPEPK